MRKMKKFFALMLAMIMAMAMTVTAFAEESSGTTEVATSQEVTLSGGTATITINNAYLEATYKIYKIFAAEYDEKTDSIAYINDQELDLSNSDYFEVQGGTVRLKDNADENTLSAEEADRLYAQVKDKVPVNGADGTKATASKLVFKNLAYGYYLIKSDYNNGSLLTVDSTNPDAVVYDKNVTVPKWDDNGGKTVISDDGQNLKTDTITYGQEVEFNLTIDTQNYAKVGTEFKQIKQYIINDDLGNGAFELVADSIHVTVNGVDTGIKASSFPFSIDWAEQKDGAWVSKYNSGDSLVVSYNATLKRADQYVATANENTATFSWTYTNNGGGTSEESKATIYTYALTINKVDPTGKPLANAKFKVYKAGSTAPIAVRDMGNGVYEYDKDSTVTEVTSPANGIIVIKGISDGTYSFEETEAPYGYNKIATIADTVEIVEGATDYSTKVTFSYKKDENGQETTETVESGNTSVPTKGISVVNQTGTELPSTGGIGTTIFYVVGSLLIIGAGIVLVARKRMDKVSR